MNHQTRAVAPLGLAGSAIIWYLGVFLQDFLPQMVLSPTWQGVLVGIFLVDGALSIIWGIIVLARRDKPDQLITSGPFALVRHPIYGGVLWSGTAVTAFVFQAWPVLLGVVPLHIWWSWLVQSEEEHLMQQYGRAYSDYAAKTGQFFPRLSQFTETDDDPGRFNG